MRKRFNFGRIGALALALTLITTCLMGGTLAKYTSTVEGKGTATAAKWKVVFKANDEAQTKAFTFDLTDAGVNKNNVVSGKVAPGSTGSIPIEIDAAGSEVAATLSYIIDKENISKMPIEFYGDEACTQKLTEFTVSKEITAGATDEEAKLSKTIYWKWVTSDDTADTGVGESATSEAITITLKAEQKIAP